MRFRVGERLSAPTLGVTCVLALVASACAAEATGPTMADTTSTSSTSTTTTLPPDPAVDGPVFRVALTSPLTTVNWWAAMDTKATPENQVVLSHTKEALFTLTEPGFDHVPSLAATDRPARPVPQGQVWVVEQTIKDDVFWSDGTQVTAKDLVFYYDVVREFGLGGEHVANFPSAVTDVAAVDDLTVRVEFNRDPLLTDWETGVAMAPLVPAHFWAPYVADARAGGGVQELYAVEAPHEPSSGTLVLDSWTPGEAAVTRSNTGYFARETASSPVGPFVSGVVWREFENESAAYKARSKGRVDFVFDPDGLDLARYGELVADGDTRLTVSQADGFRFVAFNLRKPPMSDPVFRRAVATVIDKELIASSLFSGTLFPAYTVIHPGLERFHNGDVNRPGWSDGVPMPTEERYQSAIAMLAEAGYTWDVEPQLVYDESGEFTDVVAGSGLEMPNGVDVPELTILAAPGLADDPERTTLAFWIEQWMTDLGMVVRTEPTDFDTIIDAAVSPTTSEATMAWDLHVLGWGGPNLALPGLSLVALFHSQNTAEAGGLNTTGYASPEFDAAADAFVASETLDEAARWTKEMDRIIADDLPYVTLYRPAVVEARGSRVKFPADAIMGGHGVTSGAWPSTVRLRD